MKSIHPNVKKVNNNEIAEFVTALVACNLLLWPGEADVMARNVNRQHPDYGFMRDVVATRAAHKKFGPKGE
jgi:hypothetical protein